jgi:hypothetical protein
MFSHRAQCSGTAAPEIYEGDFQYWQTADGSHCY